MNGPRLSVLVPARNERRNWPRVVEMIAAQSLQPDEIIVADGMSTDGSRELLDQLAAHDARWRIVNNPERIVSAALNVALGAARGDLVARMDTHAVYAPDYLEHVVGFLDDHADVPAVGGAMATQGRGPWGKAIAATLSRAFGLGGARHRVGGSAGPIPHVFSGCYRRSALVAIGGWDDRFRANEDFEADARLGAVIGEPWLEPKARSIWFTRESPGALAKQMWSYGYFKALTLYLHPRSLKVRQLAPPAVVLALLGSAAGGLLPWLVTTGGYVVGAGILGAWAAQRDGGSALRGALVPPIVHLAWGLGLLVGLVRFGLARGRRPTGTHQREAMDMTPEQGRIMDTEETPPRRYPRWRRIWILTPIALAVVSAALAWVGTAQTAPSYAVEATLTYVGGEPEFPDESASAAFATVTSDAVLDQVAETTNTTLVGLRRTVTTTQLGTAEGTLVVRVTASSPGSATRIANAVVDAASEQSAERAAAADDARAAELQPAIGVVHAQLDALDGGDLARSGVMSQFMQLQAEQARLSASAGTATGTLAVTQRALPPLEPVGLRGVRAAIVGAALGLVLGAVMVLAVWSNRRSPCDQVTDT